MDRFEAMHTFAKVVETGSFTKAAQALHLSRTRATHLVQQLEARLQVSLLHRTTRKVSVTSAGALYFERVVQLLADLEDSERDLAQALASPSGRLRVDVPSPLASRVLVPALPSFYARYPDIQLDMGVGDKTVDLLDESMDCVVRGGQIQDQSLIAKRVGALHLSIYAAPLYLERFGTVVHPEELDGSAHRMVGYLWEHQNKPFPYALRRDKERVSLPGRYGLAVNDGNAYLAAGEAGLGLVCLPAYLAKEAVQAGRLIALFPDWTMDLMPLYVAFHRSKHTNVRLRVFIDWVAEQLTQVS
ncbi:LysR family transcriptional regulator [Alcaligenes nematophilus]|uniref:LysR family transcriptional regulator n=2 Tax=Alcaligenes TaxID=507 RepID=A0ABU3MSW8_9BURK|nr:LysR family transcriptional regulator [Alcaligenes nematophilus]MDT8465153.1 LysR family transcriptional regulator [Alcaligenes nematophilus]MDT8467514.1 LysR family transcriptional regulator [Alcaligenes nematophilus]MDT8503991.1 LysR family transcriptional regulator [Alcaligenes nematophilus]MDT8523873.1 LysR family transcriptional regulator [Alcaligenes nematophilus]